MTTIEQEIENLRLRIQDDKRPLPPEFAAAGQFFADSHIQVNMFANHTSKTHALYCRAQYHFPPFNPWLMSFRINQWLAEEYDVPVSWLHLLDVEFDLDPAFMRYSVEAPFSLLDEEGYLKEEAVAAITDGVNEDLLPRSQMDIIQMYQRVPSAVEFLTNTNEHGIDTQGTKMFHMELVDEEE